LTAFDTNGHGKAITQDIEVAGDLKLGNFRLSFTDLTIPVTGIPINLTRTYDTLTSKQQDDFGYGWRMEFRDTDLRISLKRDYWYEEFGYHTVGFKDGERVYITLPGGKREGFTFNAQPLRSSFNSVFATTGETLFYPSFEPDNGKTGLISNSIRDDVGIGIRGTQPSINQRINRESSGYPLAKIFPLGCKC
jgi:large repetitive protein